MHFDHFGVMLDCSRNAVMKPEAVRRYIDLLARLGYNCLMLYTEDTYEVDNQPYFGYLRGRYSQQELKELDSYAREKGIELIPCIQTLAHVNAIVRWQQYRSFTDTGDILLCGDPRTYALIEDIFATLAKCFTSRTVNIGMDEAHMVGLGKYLDQNGYEDRFRILLTHLQRVCEIAKRHGFQPLMWSDMFFRLANGGHYYCTGSFDSAVTDLVPKDLGLIYWDYYSRDTARYNAMLRAHRQFDNEIWFAGGLWTWTGFAPKNAMSITNTDAAMNAVLDNGIQNVIFTVWGDDGGECSCFAILPSLYYAAQRARGVTDLAEIKKSFFLEFGIGFDDFLELDLPNVTHIPSGGRENPEKHMFYNDCFCGIFDCVVQDQEPRFAECAQRLERNAGHPVYGYLFSSAAALCRFMQIKYGIGVRTRTLYRAADREGLAALLHEYKEMLTLLDDFYEKFRKLWFLENKPFGFDVQDIRIGGLKQRILHCSQRLSAYVSGELPVIEELEEEILPEFSPAHCAHNNWAGAATASVLSMGIINR